MIAACQKHITFLVVLALIAVILMRPHLLIDHDRFFAVVRILLSDHSVCFGRDRSTGHYPDRFTRVHHTAVINPGIYLSDHLQGNWTFLRCPFSVFSPHGIAIKRRPVERRLIACGANVLGKHPSGCISESDFLRIAYLLSSAQQNGHSFLKHHRLFSSDVHIVIDILFICHIDR